MATNQLYQQIEKISEKFPRWMAEDWSLATDFIKRGEVTNVNERDFIIPFETQVGGRVGTYDPQFGDMGRGTSMKGGKMVASYFNLRLNFEIDDLTMKATATKDRAPRSPFKEAMRQAMPEFMTYVDKFFHGDGTAVLATAVAHDSSSGVSVYTLDALFQAQRLRRGQFLTIYNNGLTAPKSSSTLFINSIDNFNRKIYLSGVVPGAAADDKMCFEGVSGASPAGLKGLYYWNSVALSGTTAGINRATEPEIISNYVNAGGAISPEHIMALYHRTLMRRGTTANNMLGLVPPAQQAAIWANVMSIQRIDISGTQAQAVDRLPKLGGKGKKSFMYGDIPHYVDIHQESDRIDYIIPELWGRARLDEMKFFDTPGSGQKFFRLYGASGAPAGGFWFSLTVNEDFYCTDPGAQGVIYGLTLPALYA